MVIVGNGIAGVTAADHVRRRHPDCQIDVVANEPYPLYNRMGIGRLVYGSSAMVGLSCCRTPGMRRTRSPVG